MRLPMKIAIMPQRSDLGPYVVAIATTIALIGGLVYFVRELWPVLPPWLALIGFICLAVAVIGYPIYALYTLARLSDRHLAHHKGDHKPKRDKDCAP